MVLLEHARQALNAARAVGVLHCDELAAAAFVDHLDRLVGVSCGQQVLQLVRIGVGHDDFQRHRVRRGRARGEAVAEGQNARDRELGTFVTATTKEHVALRARASVAVHVTAESPSGNAEPEAGTQVVVTGAWPFCAVGVS